MTDRRPVRIANCSGFYGDRLTAAHEIVTGGPIDVLTGDWLAELTMLILAKAQARDGGVGWARTFLVQVEQVLERCLRDGIRIVANAGGLDPAGCADAVRAIATRRGLAVAVAHVEGDDLRGDVAAVTPPVTGDVVTANAYLGGWGIARALEAGADVVVTGRVADASLVVGPAAWWHEWAHDDWDRLAGAVVAGHVIECGPQATGGNHPFLAEIEDRRAPGFPLAEVAADGTATITKHPDTGGLVSVDTVTGQVLYEIAQPAYATPDVTAHFDTIRLRPDGTDRVAVTGVRGSPPPPTLKVAVTAPGGHRNTMTVVLTGLDIEAKAARVEALLRERLGDVLGTGITTLETDLVRFDRPDAPSNPLATAHLRITVKGPDRRAVGRGFTSALVEQALAGVAGFHTTSPPTPATAFGVFTPAAVPRAAVDHVVVLPDGTRERIPDPPGLGPADDPPAPTRHARGEGVNPAGSSEVLAGAHNLMGEGPRPDPGRGDPDRVTDGGLTTPDNDRAARSAVRENSREARRADPTISVPLGTVCGARSGDKGGDANVGLWARDDAAWAWLRDALTVDRLRQLLGPEAARLRIDRYELPNLRAVNVVVHGLLGDGVASSTRPDPQAKGLGEYLRSRHVDVPVRLLDA